MALFDFYEGDSPLHRRNPLIKLVALALIVIIVTSDLKPSTPWADPALPLTFLGLVTLALSLFGRIALTDIMRNMRIPGIIALILLVLSALSFDQFQIANPTTLLRIGPLQIYREGIISGLALAARLLAYVVCWLAFVMTTDPADFAASLTRQIGLPYRVSLTILTWYRFLPMLPGQFTMIRAAHRIRGIAETGGLGRRLRYALALLTDVIRRAERVAIARTSRGFGASSRRTQYRQTHIDGSDWAFLLAVVGITLILLDALFLLGMIDGVQIVVDG